MVICTAVCIPRSSRTYSCRSTFCTPAQSRWLSGWLAGWQLPAGQVAAWLRWLGGLLGLGGALVSVLATAMDSCTCDARDKVTWEIEDRPARGPRTCFLGCVRPRRWSDSSQVEALAGGCGIVPCARQTQSLRGSNSRCG